MYYEIPQIAVVPEVGAPDEGGLFEYEWERSSRKMCEGFLKKILD